MPWIPDARIRLKSRRQSAGDFVSDGRIQTKFLGRFDWVTTGRPASALAATAPRAARNSRFVSDDGSMVRSGARPMAEAGLYARFPTFLMNRLRLRRTLTGQR